MALGGPHSSGKPPAGCDSLKMNLVKKAHLTKQRFSQKTAGKAGAQKASPQLLNGGKAGGIPSQVIHSKTKSHRPAFKGARPWSGKTNIQARAFESRPPSGAPWDVAGACWKGGMAGAAARIGLPDQAASQLPQR